MKYISLLVLFILGIYISEPAIGEEIDRFNGVPVFYNGHNYSNVSGRNITKGGYNVGLKYQCVELVKRYYLEVFDHYMPYSYGHAKDYFDKDLGDVEYNPERGLVQYRNVRYEKPEVHDIIIYDALPGNPFGHIGIITEVTDNEIEFLQQNFGKKTRQRLKLVEFNGIYTVADYKILGWLRMP